MEPERSVRQDVDEDASGSARDDWAEDGILKRSYDHLDAARHHLLHEGPGHLGTEARPETGIGGPYPVLITDVQRDGIAFCLVEERGTKGLECDGKSKLTGSHHRFCHICRDTRCGRSDAGGGQKPLRLVWRHPPSASIQDAFDNPTN